jgi:predicted glycoside hydrolase/deacetylase ChbG (UPF0249 family)
VTDERFLIVNADDPGLSDGVNDAIVRAARDGIVTSASVLANIDGALDRVAAVVDPRSVRRSSRKAFV